MSALLELDGVVVDYGTIRALHGVDLRVPEGSVVALLGANGAGKTTTLGVVSGAVAPSAGTVHFDGRRVDGSPPHRLTRQGVCLIPEGRGVFPRLTVRENLAMFTGRLLDGHLDAVTESFPVLGQRLDQQAGTLSGGEQQMLALSRALLCRPRLLAIDEISMGLAPKVVEQLFGRVRSLAASGMTILLVEQYVREALALADFVYVLAKGRVVLVAEADDVDEASVTATYLGGVTP